MSRGLGFSIPENLADEGLQFGDRVYIAPGVKIYGDIQIESRIAIAANAAVGKSFLNSDKLIGGIPAMEIGDVYITQIIKINKLL